jgi:hypothetical protein
VVFSAGGGDGGKSPDRDFGMTRPYTPQSQKANEKVLTALALLSILLPHILSIGYGPSPAQMDVFLIKTKFLGNRSCFRAAWVHLGRYMVSLRYHAL